MTNLLINIDHVATLRNARREQFPDPVEAALICERSGADGVVFHLREDRRHINDDDVARLKENIQSKLDFELSIADDIVAICVRTKPDLATLVPERREEVTTEGGLDVIRNREHLIPVIHRLHDAGIGEVALFVDPLRDQVDAAVEVGADAIEIHTGEYANTADPDRIAEILGQYTRTAEYANASGLKVHAGHGLDYENWSLFQESVPHVREVSIGFAIIAHSIFVGLETAVSRMAELVKSP